MQYSSSVTVCHPIRAPGVKCTLLAVRRDGPGAVAMMSKDTVPVNQSAGPTVVLREFRVICIALFFGSVLGRRLGVP